jgi:lipopolysaccharide transport system permease protein
VTLPVVVTEAGREPGVARHLSPAGFVRHLWRHRRLVWQFARRDVEGRYRGSLLGLAWTIVNPLVLLVTYTLVFGGLFAARWPEARSQGLGAYGIALFCGLTAFNLFAECVTRAPTLIVAVPNFVRKVVFPLEILPVSAVASALAHALVALGVLLVVQLATVRELQPTLLLLPLVSLPLLFLSLGVAWFLAGLGVYLRDISQGTGLVLQVLMFGTPIFYPPSVVPPWLRPALQLNPLAAVVENWRSVLLWGRVPDWTGLGAWILVTAVTMLLGYAWFMSTRRGFADVL